MRRIAMGALWVVWLSFASSGIAAEDPQVLEVWPGKPPSESGNIGAEKFRPPPKGANGVIANGSKWLTNVTKPTLTLYRPAKNQDQGAAVVICPGGGYWNLAWDLEGEEVAAWLNSIGVTGIILKYRVPRRPGQPEALPAPGPLQDAQRAVSLVRSHAPQWNIDPKRIGMVGFSAGGHLTVATATNFDKRSYEPIDDIDKVSCRPDFAISVYPGYLVVRGTENLAPYIRIPPGTPPIFLVHAGDDSEAKADNSVVMYQALKRAGVPTELHIYAVGEHGFGVRKGERPVCNWTGRCADWLRNQGVLKPSAGP